MADESPVAEVVVEPAKSGLYKVTFRQSGTEDLVEEIRLTRRSRKLRARQVTYDPPSLAFEAPAFAKKFQSTSRIDLLLPPDPIASLDWENLSHGRVFRRTRRDFAFRRSPLSGPLKFGFVSTVDLTQAPSELAHAIAESIQLEGAQVKMMQVKEWEDFDNSILPERFHVLHLLVETELTPRGPFAVIGKRRVPLAKLIEKVAQPGTRFAVLHDVTDDRGALAALRWGAQSLPTRSESSVLLCSADPRSNRFVGGMGKYYSSMFRDESLDRCVQHLNAEHERNGISLVAHRGTRLGLGLSEDLALRNQRHSQLREDMIRLGAPRATNRLWRQQFKSPLALKAAEDESALMLTHGDEETFMEEKDELKTTAQKVLKKANERGPRYPAAWFYHVDAADDTPIPDTQTLTWPPPAGIGLEFHFWLDVIKSGIASITETASIREQDLPYPLLLQVTVWSADFKFANDQDEIELPAIGPTKHARFIVNDLPAAPRQVELFVFVRHEGTLIAAFRVEAGLTEETEVKAGAQKVEHVYLASNWFQFENSPAPSALTIFISKRSGYLQIFTLQDKTTPWARLGPTESGLYESNKEIYQEVQKLSLLAETASEQGRVLNFLNQGGRLARLSHPLFSAIFMQGEPEAANFVKERLAKLPEGSTLTIAIGEEAKDLFVPWGLLYTEQPPMTHYDVPSLDGFLGYRYNLVVRPSLPIDLRKARPQLPIRIGAAWLDHAETKVLKDSYQPFVDSKKIVIEPITASNYKLPALGTTQYDLIEFFCHGHTKLSGVFTAAERKELIANYKKAATESDKTSLLQAIEDSEGDSLLDLNGGFVTLSSLADTLTNPMPGCPIVLLSMCESAQVSAAGTGFVPLFLRRGARSVIGTEGPTLWSLSREMDTKIVTRLLDGQSIGDAFYQTRKELAAANMLALIYTLYGDGGARLV